MTPFAPYLAPADWYRRRLAAMLAGGGSLPEAPRRELMRTMLRGKAGEEVRLSVPVSGGASAIKHGDPLGWEISEHGRWREMHLGALDACLSSTPYYQHLLPRIEGIIREVRPAAALFCRSLDAEIMDFLKAEELLPALRQMAADTPALYEARRRDAACLADYDQSIVALLCRLGPEAIFALLPPL